MLTDVDITRRSGAYRGGGAGMRGLGSSCCTDCADNGGLGDVSAIGAVISQSKALDWLLVVSLSIGAIAGSLAIFDHLKKRRRPVRRYTSPTMQIPSQSMKQLVYGDEA